MRILNFIGTLAAVALTTTSPAATQSLPFADAFSYSNGNLFTVAAGVWDAGGSSGGEFTVATNAALVAPAGLASASGSGVVWSPSGTARRNLSQFSAVSSGEIYVSFLLNVVTAPTSSRLFAYLDNTTSSTSSPQLGLFLNGTTLGIGKKASSASVTTNLPAGTHFVVARYTFQTGDDRVDFWVNPASYSFGALIPPPALGGATGGSDPASLIYFALNASSGSGPALYLDEVRIGTTWAEVTPIGATVPPVPSSLMITQAFWSPDGMVLRGSGGTPGGAFQVLSVTNCTLDKNNWPVLGNHQFNGSGNFDCTNPVSLSESPRFFTLRTGAVTNPPVTPPGAPEILYHPQDISVAAGQSAVFSLIVTGSPSPAIQWFYNDNIALAGETNRSLILDGVQDADAGSYSATVTNVAGEVTSAFALLTVLPEGANNYDMIGFASLGGGTTGGAGGATVTVNSSSALESALNMSVPLIVQVQGTINIGTIDSKPNKTIVGLGSDATLVGNLKITHTTNIIVRNLTLRDSNTDGITIQESIRVWVDHCTFVNNKDGNLDITHGSDWVTISWCKFYYTRDNDHNFSNLIGHNDNNASEDAGSLRITWHHNWWGDMCVERLPSVRFGRAHVFNNYYYSPGNNYCVRTRIQAECRVENNFFQNVQNPWEQYITSPGHVQGKLFATNNNIAFLGTDYGVTWTGSLTNRDSTIRAMIPGTDQVFALPYSHPLQGASDVPAAITNNAGAGKGPFAP